MTVAIKPLRLILDQLDTPKNSEDLLPLGNARTRNNVRLLLGKGLIRWVDDERLVRVHSYTPSYSELKTVYNPPQCMPPPHRLPKALRSGGYFLPTSKTPKKPKRTIGLRKNLPLELQHLLPPSIP